MIYIKLDNDTFIAIYLLRRWYSYYFYILITFQIHAIKYYNCNTSNLNPSEEKIYIVGIFLTWVFFKTVKQTTRNIFDFQYYHQELYLIEISIKADTNTKLQSES